MGGESDITAKIADLLKNKECITDSASQIADEVVSGRLSILDLVVGLGPYLTDPDKERRLQGCLLLCRVLALLPTDRLNQDEVKTLGAWLVDRLKDHYSVVPSALSGLAAICSMGNLYDEAVSDILLAFQQNITCQALTQSSRLDFYTILERLLMNKKEVILRTPGEFLYTLVSGMDSESDPRNLLFLFSFVPHVLRTLPLGNLEEEFFSVLECYFPVDFNPIEDKANISREDLARGLEACFLANSSLGHHILPMICEKLESTLKTARLDSLRLLVQGAPVWNPDILSSASLMLWPVLREVCFQSDPEQMRLAIEGVAALVRALSVAPLSRGETADLATLLKSISSGTHHYLKDPALSLFSPVLKLLTAVAQVSRAAADFIIESVVPQLLVLLEMSPEHREVVLKGLPPILEASFRYDCWDTDPSKSLLENVAPILCSLIPKSGAGSPLGVFVCLSLLAHKMEPDLRSSFYPVLLNVVFNEESPSVRQDCRKCILTLSKQFPEEVEKNLISNISLTGTDGNVDGIKRPLEMLTWLCDLPSHRVTASTALLNYLTNTSQQNLSLGTITVLREFVSTASVTTLSRLSNECCLTEKLLEHYLRGGDHEVQAAEVQAAAGVLTFIVRALTFSEQKNILEKGLDLFTRQINASVTPTTELILLEGLAIGLRRGLELENSLGVAQVLLPAAILPRPEEAPARLLAVLLNKETRDDVLDSLLDETCRVLGDSLSPAGVRLHSWITKALVYRSHPKCDHWIEKLLQLLTQAELANSAADGLKLIISESDVLSEENYCIVSPLYKQRLFEKLPRLLPLMGQTEAVQAAVAHILSSAPLPLLKSRISELTGVLVKCLEPPGRADVTPLALQVLSNLLSVSSTEDSHTLTSLADTFIPRCLILATTSPLMEVRGEAIDCLYYYGRHNAPLIVPYKSKVLNGLKCCLDDKKRLVRRRAVRARLSWYIV